MKKSLYYNAQIIFPDRISWGAVLVEGKTITKILKEEDVRLEDFIDTNCVDIKGNYLSAGFIDIHVHGGGGYDFMDGTEDAFRQIAKVHARHGTTSLVPTTLTTTIERLEKTLNSYEKVNEQLIDGAQFLGMHLEGPYFALAQRGAQDPRYIRVPDPQEYCRLIDRYPCIARWSAAPELPGALEFGAYLSKKNIIAAIAHTDAIYEDVVAANNVGFNLMTHFYSAMSGVSRRNAFRYAGVIEAGYLIDDFDLELIADGIHLPDPLLRLVYKVKGPDKMVLITDAMRAAGTCNTESVLGSFDDGLQVLIEDGVAKLKDRSAFAGSIATADRLIKTMLKLGNIPLEEVIRMITLNPARVMKVDRYKGTIDMGKDADLVVFDDHVNIVTTIVNGRVIYQRD